MREGKQVAPPGGERRVHEDLASSTTRLIKTAHEQLESAEFIKARFHLMKLLHLLLPKGIPNIHAAYSEPDALVVERKWPSRKTLDGERAQSKLQATLGSLGVTLDVYPGNFLEEKDGYVYYVDSVDPWMDMGSHLRPQYSETALKNAIQEKISDPTTRNKASLHLKRLSELLKEANQKNQKK